MKFVEDLGVKITFENGESFGYIKEVKYEIVDNTIIGVIQSLKSLPKFKLSIEIPEDSQIRSSINKVVNRSVESNYKSKEI